MEYNAFVNRLLSIRKAESISGARNYVDIKVASPYLTFRREGKSEFERIKLDELYKFYTSGEELKTTVAKNYISGRVQSPAVAVLLALK
jgi:hypothetical protein